MAAAVFSSRDHFLPGSSAIRANKQMCQRVLCGGCRHQCDKQKTWIQERHGSFSLDLKKSGHLCLKCGERFNKHRKSFAIMEIDSVDLLCCWEFDWLEIDTNLMSVKVKYEAITGSWPRHWLCPNSGAASFRGCVWGHKAVPLSDHPFCKRGNGAIKTEDNQCLVSEPN